MSRSYKKTPWTGDKKGKSKKRCANSKIRMFLKNPNHKLQNNSYKKVYDSYDICDYGWLETWEQYKKELETRNYLYPPEEKIDWKKEYRHWYKTYKMK